jgi:glutamine phosphoribosylpyrophosphate amidotransferase
MCGVIGYASDDPQPSHSEALRSLFYESRVRGLHAFGFSTQDGERVVTQRFLDLKVCLAAIPSGAARLIGHCRYSTSGDFRNVANNQPLQIDDAALAFNGVISMATKGEYERHHGREYKTENDGEIFLDKFVRNDGWLEFVARGRFSFAGLTLHRGRLTALRNKSRPLFRVDQGSATFFASTADIFRRAGFAETPTPIPCGVAVDVG